MASLFLLLMFDIREGILLDREGVHNRHFILADSTVYQHISGQHCTQDSSGKREGDLYIVVSLFIKFICHQSASDSWWQVYSSRCIQNILSSKFLESCLSLSFTIDDMAGLLAIVLFIYGRTCQIFTRYTKIWCFFNQDFFMWIRFLPCLDFFPPKEKLTIQAKCVSNKIYSKKTNYLMLGCLKSR